MILMMMNLELNYFMATFKEAVETKVDDPKGRLTHLIKHTKGEANELIRNCIQEDSHTGYTHAITLLQNQYGNPHFISRAYIKELHNWEPLKAGDSKMFRKFYSFLIKCKTHMSSGFYLQELNSPDILQVLQSKLPRGLQEKWNRTAVKLRTLHHREANFDDYLSIVEVENMVVNDPMYSREAVESRTIHNNNHTTTPVSPSKLSAFATNLNMNTEHKPQTNKNCAYCNQNHDIDDCAEFLKLSMKYKKSFMFRNRLCFSCFRSVSSTHMSKTCNNKRKCNICNNLHPTAFHDDFDNDNGTERTISTAATGCGELQPTIKEEEIIVDDSQTGNDEFLVDNQLPTHDEFHIDIPVLHHNPISSCTNNSNTEIEMISMVTECAAKPDYVISLCVVPVKVRHISQPTKTITVYAMLDHCSEGTFVTDEVVEMLAVDRKPTSIGIRTLNGMTKHASSSAVGLQVSAVCDLDGQSPNYYQLPKTYTRELLPIEQINIPTYDKIKQYNHFKAILHEIP